MDPPMPCFRHGDSCCTQQILLQMVDSNRASGGSGPCLDATSLLCCSLVDLRASAHLTSARALGCRIVPGF